MVPKGSINTFSDRFTNFLVKRKIPKGYTRSEDELIYGSDEGVAPESSKKVSPHNVFVILRPVYFSIRTVFTFFNSAD